MREQVQEWRRIDENLLGPDATLRLLTIAGSTGYTSYWWGQGRSTATCRTIVGDAEAARVALPAPYDTCGADQLIADLTDPDQVSDQVLGWLIDPPSGLRGLRMHPDATAPIQRTLTDG